MGEARHSFTGPPHTCGHACTEAAQQTMTTLQAHPQEPQWDTGYGAGYSSHHEGGSYYPSHDYTEPSLRARTFACARFYLFCSIACFWPVDCQVESELSVNFQDINFEDLEQQQVGFECKCP
jgi:hypothetical protein